MDREISYLVSDWQQITRFCCCKIVRWANKFALNWLIYAQIICSILFRDIISNTQLTVKSILSTVVIVCLEFVSKSTDIYINISKYIHVYISNQLRNLVRFAQFPLNSGQLCGLLIGLSLSLICTLVESEYFRAKNALPFMQCTWNA